MSGNLGAGVWAGSSANLTNVTMTKNGWAGLQMNGPATIVMKNVLLADNPGPNCTSLYTLGFAGSFSLSDDGSCNIGSGRDNVVILLGPLANNGGATLTHLPLAGTQAIDGGTGAGAPTTDQRGFMRPAGSAVDVGAVEVQPIPPAATATATRTVVPTATRTPTPTATRLGAATATATRTATRTPTMTATVTQSGGNATATPKPPAKKVFLPLVGR